MRTLKVKAQPANAFFATVKQMFGGSYCRASGNQIVEYSSDERGLGSIEFQSPHVIETRSNGKEDTTIIYAFTTLI